MKFKDISKDAVCELLLFLAENEEFQSIREVHGFRKNDIQDILRQIATQLRAELSEETSGPRPQNAEYNLSSKAVSLISCLSPREELLLLKSFRLV